MSQNSTLLLRGVELGHRDHFNFYSFAVPLKPLLCGCPRVGRAPSLPYTAFVGWHLPVTWLIYRSPGRQATAGQHIGAGWGPCAKRSAPLRPEHHENEYRWQAYCKIQSCSWQADSRSSFCGTRRFITVLTTVRHCFVSPSRCIQNTLTLVSLKIQLIVILFDSNSYDNDDDDDDNNNNNNNNNNTEKDTVHHN